MTRSHSVEEYVARQPSLAWRRQILRSAIQGALRLLTRLTVTGAERLPDSGPTILMMNHLSLLDPVLCMAAVRNRFVIPMTKIETLRSPFVGPFVIWWGAYTVDRSEIDRKALTNSIELVKSGQLILIAPEGTRQTQLSEPKDGLAYVATKADAVIVPTGISGTLNWQRPLFTLQRPPLHVNFGPPFKFKTDGRPRVARDDLHAMSREAMFQLAAAIEDESLRGVYSDLSQATTDHLEFIDAPQPAAQGMD
ncbi:MAG: 1-acyl-sn-glycerol-3-phosphate acyltransferase [Chloroflexi bacterium]|nr:1-acyl-sn-glycerol-3-phosphate acyltransferase [Chloroflexota bacterium]